MSLKDQIENLKEDIKKRKNAARTLTLDDMASRVQPLTGKLAIKNRRVLKGKRFPICLLIRTFC